MGFNIFFYISNPIVFDFNVCLINEILNANTPVLKAGNGKIIKD